MRFKKISIGSIIVLAVLAVGLSNFRSISDWYSLRDYTPPPRVVELADQTTMQDQTRRIFYIYRPSLDDKQTFNRHCKSGEKTIVLGCFIEHKGIYLLDVDDPRLHGILQVTAAHEVLHAHYDRLGKDEKTRVDKMLEEAFTQVSNQRIKTTIESYRSSGADISNELHSILGTEVENLPSELESYYSKYFKNRQQIVQYLKQYESAFEDLKKKVEEDDRKLASLKQTIDANQTQLEADGRDIDQERKRLDTLLSARQVETYNQAVPSFNQMVQSYNQLVARTKDQIAGYNALVEERNNVVTQQEELHKAIDSSNLTTKQ